MQFLRYDAPAGTDVKALLQKCLHSILGSALPYKETGDAEERALANTVTAGGLLLKHLTGRLQTLLLTCCVAFIRSYIVTPGCCRRCLVSNMIWVKTEKYHQSQASTLLLVLAHQRAYCFAAIDCCTSLADFAYTLQVGVFAYTRHASVPINLYRVSGILFMHHPNLFVASMSRDAWACFPNLIVCVGVQRMSVTSCFTARL